MSRDRPPFLPEIDQISASEKEEHEFIRNSERKPDVVEHEIAHESVIEIGYRQVPRRQFELLFRVQMDRLPDQHELEAFERGDWHDAGDLRGRPLRPRER